MPKRASICVCGGVPYFHGEGGKACFFFAESVVAALILSVSA